ncbi:DEKNAAC103682 [Brettanomyces naardenensis]|uniref:DEKNAAC103682 n=1 Tax=Brettanomyces naardenensis TaxID=13370 RepID=A0A448YP61_BRENA|nr:DEKNAAC103682 [Brettanomyces naardenensis]
MSAVTKPWAATLANTTNTRLNTKSPNNTSARQHSRNRSRHHSPKHSQTNLTDPPVNSFNRKELIQAVSSKFKQLESEATSSGHVMVYRSTIGEQRAWERGKGRGKRMNLLEELSK